MTASVAALRAHHKRLCRMLADPKCVGELLLVGVGIARALDLNDPFPVGPTTRLYDFNTPIYGGTCRIRGGVAMPEDDSWFEYTGVDRRNGRVAEVLVKDIRRYVAPSWHTVRTCGRPRVRVDGLCGRPASPGNTELVTDIETGLRSRIGSCTNQACKKWVQDTVARNRRECAQTPPPRPPANAGGVLDTHLPEIDWWQIYRALDPRWTPPPEGQAFHKPKLQLIVDQATVEHSDARRPALSLIEGGWSP